MKQLCDRLNGARDTLAEVIQKIAGDPTAEKIVSECYGDLRAAAIRVDEWLDLIGVRSLALEELKKMPKPVPQAIPSATAAPPPFRFQRLLACQAYLAVSWSLSDEITQWAGGLLTSPKLAKNPALTCNLPHFAQSGGHAINPLSLCFNNQFEWPIDLSYSLRNLFLHDGGWGIFDGADAADGFRVENDGWERVLSGTKKADPAKAAPGFPPFIAPITDLRSVFEACEAEMDEALGVLLATACGLLRVHACCLLGEQ